MRLIWGTVATIESEFQGIQRIQVRIPGRDSAEPAIVYTALCATVGVGTEVLINTTAVDLSLGTGGSHIVVARAGAGESLNQPAQSGGHIMKLRYTPLQLDVLSVESPESSHHSTMEHALDVGGMPVVCCALHSQVPLVAAAIKSVAPEARVAYCMTDEAALPLQMSDVLARSVRRGLIDLTVSCGQAFGGILEAVTLHSGLLAAKHVAYSDVAIVAMGPGMVGTGTPFGHGGIAVGEAINAAASVGGVPIAALRVSFADERERHLGVSHHSLTALSKIALTQAIVPMVSVGEREDALIDSALDDAGVWDRHVRMDLPPLPQVDMRTVRVKTMGRSEEQDPAFFAFSYVAGGAAALRLL